MKKIFIILILWLCFSNHAYASDPDFVVKFSACKIATGYLVLSDNSLKVFDGDPSIMGCNRTSTKVSCFYEFEDNQQINTVEYVITLDSPPLLHFSTSNGSEYIAVNTTEHSAVIITRILQGQYAGSKVCQGVYATMFEIDSLGNN